MRRHLALTTTAALLSLAACASPTTTGSESSDESLPADFPTATITLTTPGAVVVLDAASLDELGRIDMDGYLRVADAGDAQHVVITSPAGFTPINTGAGTGEPPTAAPVLMQADEPGHVVPHGGTTLLWDDATGSIGAFPTEDIGSQPSVAISQVPEAHHGVAVPMPGGDMVVTVGTSESRSGAALIDANGEVLAEATDCPGIHGEGALGETILFGCNDGLLIMSDSTFTKIDAPGDYGRIGNLYLTEASSIAVGDFKSDPDAEGVALTQLSLMDTESGALSITDLPQDVSYTWRGVDRASNGDILVLGTDGALHRLSETGDPVEATPLLDTWTAPLEWQEAHPALEVHGDVAFVTDPANERVIRLDLVSGTTTETTIGAAATEIEVVGSLE